MQLLYIRRHFWEHTRSYLQNRVALKKRYTKFKDQDGFVRGSLYHRFDVTERPLGYLGRIGALRRHFDYVVVNHKADSSGTGAYFAGEWVLPDRFHNRPTILYLGDERADWMPGDALLDRFDLILKRQPYADLDRYPIAARNKNKIRPTTLACPLVPATKKNIRDIRPADYGFEQPAAKCDADVFFSGQANNARRTEAWRRLCTSDLYCLGGLQRDDTRGLDAPETLTSAKLRKPAYIDAMRHARINLALAGRGAFTYRHVEAWCLACFVLCSPDTRELRLPFPARENEHYVCYDDIDDLMHKVRYFIAAPEARARIAAAGRRLFEDYFSFCYHGRQLHYWFDHPTHAILHPPGADTVNPA